MHTAIQVRVTRPGADHDGTRVNEIGIRNVEPVCIAHRIGEGFEICRGIRGRVVTCGLDYRNALRHRQLNSREHKTIDFHGAEI